jgi:hypothetical protein
MPLLLNLTKVMPANVDYRAVADKIVAAFDEYSSQEGVQPNVLAHMQLAMSRYGYQLPETTTYALGKSDVSNLIQLLNDLRNFDTIDKGTEDQMIEYLIDQAS